MSSMESGRMDSFESTEVTESIEPTEIIDKGESDKIDFSDCGNNETKKDTENNKQDMVEEFNKCEKDDSSYQEDKETVSEKEICFDNCAKTESDEKQCDEEYENYNVFDDCSSTETVEDNQNDINNQNTHEFDSCAADNIPSVDSGFVDDTRIQEGMYKQEFDRFEEEKPTVDILTDSSEINTDSNNSNETLDNSEYTGDAKFTDESKETDSNTESIEDEPGELKKENSDKEVKEKYEQQEQKERELNELENEQQESESDINNDSKDKAVEEIDQSQISDNPEAPNESVSDNSKEVLQENNSSDTLESNSFNDSDESSLNFDSETDEYNSTEKNDGAYIESELSDNTSDLESSNNTEIPLDDNNQHYEDEQNLDNNIDDHFESSLEDNKNAINETKDNSIDYSGEDDKNSEVFYPFKQENWEQMTIQEQKQAVEKLADYNAEILEIEDKPNINYYNVEDPYDFGGYSAKQNTIYINEYNMNNAAETADTISHEYRHKYQHERAEKLETEQDFEFKNGFENYIRPEDDYQGYKNQLVESDARAYAQTVKDKISLCSEKDINKISVNSEQDTIENSYNKRDLENETSFKKVSVDNLPDDFEQKERIKYKEVLEEKELDELRSTASIYYENGKQVANKVPEFNTYKEHNDIETGHIEKVRVKSLQAADALEAHFSNNDYDGLFSPNIDRRTIEVMSIYHDTGMDGNIKVEDYELEKAKYLANESNREKFVTETLNKRKIDASLHGESFNQEMEESKANQDFEKEGFEKHFRPEHSLESAIHVLRDRDKINEYGVNVDEIALGCLSHSKSNSGLKNIASEDDWRTAVNRLQDRVDEFNRNNPDEQIYFDKSFLLNKDGSFKQEKLSEMRSEVIVLRIGDANGHNYESHTSQNGKTIDFSLEEKEIKDNLPSDFEIKYKKGYYENYFLEVQSADVKIDGIELNNVNDSSGISRMFAVGEGNFRSLDCEIDNNGNIRQTFELCDGNAFPLSTQKCIEERLGEYKTAQPMNYTPVIILGNNCSDEAYNSYMTFANRIEDEYNVEVEVVR